MKNYRCLCIVALTLGVFAQSSFSKMSPGFYKLLRLMDVPIHSMEAQEDEVFLHLKNRYPSGMELGKVMLVVAEATAKNSPNKILLSGSPFDPDRGYRSIWVGISSGNGKADITHWVTFSFSEDNLLLDVSLTFN